MKFEELKQGVTELGLTTRQFPARTVIFDKSGVVVMSVWTDFSRVVESDYPNWNKLPNKVQRRLIKLSSDYVNEV
ncbi:hypothetical protein [Ligilactobacillus equi]|uniref:Uncharacterized protein n=1 Tax=Ligilactobacillus equi DPC 6820 TaxID=1392007 RepID=V7HV11_9LACO|nr:hypothetical protein [Ligilactobacillus equi]ETA74059.1 hypothetical protein LEQ_1519c [Ligilactobacillus equi DPC 6820]